MILVQAIWPTNGGIPIRGGLVDGLGECARGRRGGTVPAGHRRARALRPPNVLRMASGLELDDRPVLMPPLRCFLTEGRLANPGAAGLKVSSVFGN